MLKIKRKYLGKVLKGGGVSIQLLDTLTQSQLQFVLNRWGKEYITTIKVKENVDSTEKPSE
jgi:hypothetical protein